MESGRRRRSSSQYNHSGNGESSGSSNGSGSSSRRRRSSSSGGSSSRRSDRTNFREDAGAGKKAFYLVLTLGGILALCVGFYIKFNPDASNENQPPPQAATPTPTPTPSPSPADGSAPPEPPRNLGLTMEQYLDKLDSFGDHLQDQSDFSKSAVHAHVDWRCKVYSSDTDSLVKSVLLLSATPADKEYRVNAFFNKPDAALISRLRLLQRGDIVRVTGVINEEDIRDIDADNLVLSN